MNNKFLFRIIALKTRYLSSVYPGNPPKQQIEECGQAYMAGFFESLMYAHEMPKEEIKKAHEELTVWFEERMKQVEKEYQNVEGK